MGTIAFSQTDIPDEPRFISASVIPESEPTTVVLKWNPSDSVDVAGYLIYEVVNTVTLSVDTVWGRLTTECNYSQSNSNTTSEIFRLASFDNLFFKSKITDPHKTMFLTQQYDKCNNKVDLAWTAYEGWSGGISKYIVYRRSQSGTYTQVATVSSTVLTFSDDDIDLNETYLYYIEAIGNYGSRSTSNSVVTVTTSYVLPAFLYAEYATVVGEDIALKFVVDNTAEVIEYRIQRSLTANGSFSTIKSVASSGTDEILVSDADVNVNETRYFYRIASVNPCGIINSYSNICSNIVLTVTTEDDLNHSIEWNQYENWENGVFDYRVYRYFDGIGSEIAVNSSGNLDYTYDIAWYVDYCHDRKVHMTNKFCYYVEAYENTGHTYSTNQGVSQSNISCVYLDPICWLPNAFNVSSYNAENREFKPVLSFAEKDAYEFIIYDKWGMEIFKTDQTYEGWNGTINFEDYAPSQYYTYVVKYFDHKKKEHLQTGTFFLMIE